MRHLGAAYTRICGVVVAAALQRLPIRTAGNPKVSPDLGRSDRLVLEVIVMRPPI